MVPPLHTVIVYANTISCQKVTTQSSAVDPGNRLQDKMKDAFEEAESFVKSMSTRQAMGETLDTEDAEALALAKNILQQDQDQVLSRHHRGVERPASNLSARAKSRRGLFRIKSGGAKQRVLSGDQESQTQRDDQRPELAPASSEPQHVLQLSQHDRLHHGGPVLAMSVLHTGKELMSGKYVMDSVYFSECKQLLWGLVNLTGPNVRYFLGIATWMEGQLQDELNRGYWIQCRAPADVLDLYDQRYWDKKKTGKLDSLWYFLMMSMGGEYPALAQIPEDLLEYQVEGEDDEDDDDLGV